MSKNNYIELVKDLRFPSEEQVLKFTEWICSSLSWYKYDDLLEGANLVVFIDPKLESSYDPSLPRYHGWRTRKEYIQVYGYLGFAYKFKSEDNYEPEGRDKLGFELPSNFFSKFN